MNKIAERLIIANGILLPALFIFFIYRSFYYQPDYGYDDNSDGAIVGEELDQALRDSLILQGLRTDGPIALFNSTNLYLPLSVMTYEEAKTYKEMVAGAGDMAPPRAGTFNIIFLDQQYEVIGKLVDRKACITLIDTPNESYRGRDQLDTSRHHIAYMIAFEDTNKDGKLDGLDDQDLYLSGLDGKNLVQVTKQIDIEFFNFIHDSKDVLVVFVTRDNLRKEYKRTKLGIYNIASGTFRELTDIERTIKEIERTLIYK